MSIPTFFQSDLCRQQTSITLNPQEAAHALRVKRLRKDDALCVLNGSGLRADCTITEVGRNSVDATVGDWIEFTPKSKKLTIASAIPKRDRQRTMVDMLTQLGVSRIIPLECQRSVTHFKQSTREKWQRYAIEACKQSQNPWMPEIATGTRLQELLINFEPDTVYVNADINGKKLIELATINDDMVIIIGPEGGFSEQELSQMDDAGVKRLYLADQILRTELAAVTATAQFFNM